MVKQKYKLENKIGHEKKSGIFSMVKKSESCFENWLAI